ncbi:hypothetical protein U9M48_013082 [Paspalum notatum var. saurae]|uniref:Reverse transcriptase domain-containing protein n=1 Tax=Paspalum notatum var. saurae TaxID=547442 RepID=A0AAQ3SZB4_PASNO
MNVREKLGPNPANCAYISNFCAWIKECGLFYLGFHGPAYTWSNKRFSSFPTFQRLDRCLANSDWITTFPNTDVYHLPMLYSDHCPILLNIDSKKQLIKKLFRFENWWMQEEDFQQVAEESWFKSRNRDFALKTTYLATDLKKWRKKKPNISDQLASIENQLQVLQDQAPTLSNHRRQNLLIQQHHNNMQKNDKYHRQRAKKTMDCIGARKNRIPFIITQDGSSLTTNEHIADCFKCYFTNLFSSQLNDLPPQDQNDDNLQGSEPLNDAYTDSIPTAQEIWDIVKNMRMQDVTRLVTDFYNSRELPQILNKTFITLILKGMNANTPQNFRPISLCNVIYKIISSTIAKRIKNHLPSYIHESQAAFIPSRYITSNIILAQEITHSFSLKNWNQHAFMLKIDLAKAFDYME